MSNTRGRSLKRTVAGVSAGVLSLTGAAAALAVPASAQSTFSFTRLAGPDRYATAAAIATSSFTTSDTVLVASGQNFPDALAGNYLAGNKNAPILLTATNSLPAATKTALATLKAKNVIIVGGTSAVSSSVEAAIGASGVTVTRVAGNDRYATAKAIAEGPGAANVGGDAAGVKTAILASGQNFADALTAGPLGYAKSFPVAITTPSTLSPDTKAVLTDLKIKNVLIAGGTVAVSQVVEDQVKAMGITVTRLAGSTRQLTAVAIADYETSNGFVKSHVNLARGDDFADALAGGPHAGREVAPILLTDTPAVLGAAATAYLTLHSDTLLTGNIFGGTAAVSDAVKTSAETAAKGTQAASLTTRPELRNAIVGGTVNTSQANVANPQGTTVQYVFDEQVLTATAANFELYQSSDMATATPSIVSVSGNTVTVRYDSIIDTTGAGPTNINNYTLAAVAMGAVLDGQNQTNPEGSASIGSAAASTTVAAADTTVAPDLRSIGNFRQANPAPGQFPNSTAVDFTFDQAATAPATTGYHLVQPDGTILNGTGPIGATVANGGTASGGTVPGGQGTTIITVVFPNTSPAMTPVTLVAADVVRGYADLGTVQDSTALSSNESIAVKVSNNGITTGPDLLSVTVAQAGSTNNTGPLDQVLYTFDSAATTPVQANFQVFKSTAGTPTNASAAVNVTGQPNQVLASFPAGTLQDGAGAVALTGAVVGSVTDERGFVAPSVSSSNRTPGQVTAPQLKTVAIASTTDITGATNFTATYTFDKSIGAGAVVAGNFHLYDSNGNELNGATCAVPSAATATNAVVICDTFTDTNNPVTADTLQKKVGAATLGTVSVGAVVGNTAPNTGSNPEGAAATTGGTGTPAA